MRCTCVVFCWHFIFVHRIDWILGVECGARIEIEWNINDKKKVRNKRKTGKIVSDSALGVWWEYLI